MKPYYERAGITIYHGDAREILPAIDTALEIRVRALEREADRRTGE